MVRAHPSGVEVPRRPDYDTANARRRPGEASASFSEETQTRGTGDPPRSLRRGKAQDLALRRGGTRRAAIWVAPRFVGAPLPPTQT